MKKCLILTIMLLAAISIVGCSGGGSGTPESAGIHFQEGLTPKDISGCFNTNVTTTKNTCNLPATDQGTNSICIEQDGSKATITVFSDTGTSASDKQVESMDANINIPARIATLSTYSGTVSGNSFKGEKAGSSSNESCAMTSKQAIIGTVSGDTITGNMQETITATGDCTVVPPGNCEFAVTYSGSRTANTQASTPVTGTTVVPNSDTQTGLPAGSSVDYAAPLPKEEK